MYVLFSTVSIKALSKNWSSASPPDVRRGSATPYCALRPKGSALSPGCARRSEGQVHRTGVAQERSDSVGAAKPRLTSGGKAEAIEIRYLRVKAAFVSNVLIDVISVVTTRVLYLSMYARWAAVIGYFSESG